MDGELRGMVMAFRIPELQSLLAFAGKNKQGRKNELQARALELVKSRTPPVVLKMKELYRQIQASNYAQPLVLSGPNSASHGISSVAGGNMGSRYGNSGYYSSDYGQQDTTFGRHLGHHRVLVDGQYRTLPICPDIKMKELPFFDIISVLIRPTSLIHQGQLPKQEISQSFCLTPSQASDIASSREFVPGGESSSLKPEPKIQYNVQVQLRFCALDTTEDQEDLFPQSLMVKVNGRNVPLPHPIPSNRPGVEPKRPSKPLNVTNSVKCSPTTANFISVQWVADTQRNYTMSVYLVRRLTADDLFQRLKKKNIQPADFTRGRIKEITTAEEEDLCAPTSIRVSVACPLGKNRMSYPCRGINCKHLQCFDANLFLLMNEKKPTFICPVCNKYLKFDDLTIDGYFMDVIKTLSINSGNDIELYADGSWQPAVKVKNEIEDVGPPPKRMKPDNEDNKGTTSNFNQTIDLDNDDICIVDDEIPAPGGSSHSHNNSKPPAAEPEVIDLLDSSDEDDDATRGSVSNSNSNVNTYHQQATTQERQVDSGISISTAQEDNVAKEGEREDSDDEEVVVRRPRRKATKMNYVEDSSSDSSGDEGGPKKEKSKSKSQMVQRPESPAYIELSDSAPSSPEPEQQRAFAAVSNQSRPTSASSQPNNNRTGSGSSMYSSSTISTTGIGLHNNPSVNTSTTVSASHLLNSQMSSFTLSTSSTSSSSVLSPSPQVQTPTSSHPTASSLLYSSTSSNSAPGYTAYDARSSWDDFMGGIHQQLDYGLMMNQNPFDYINTSTQPPNNYQNFDPRAPRGGGAGGGGYTGWM